MRLAPGSHIALALLVWGGCATEEPERRSTLRIVDLGDPRATTTTPPPPAGACARLSWPVEAPLSSPFGVRDGRPHQGIDLAVPEDTEVRAACDGIVAYAGRKLRGYGNLVILDHAGLSTVYAHNRLLLVHEGERVVRGQPIARSGATGHVTAPHLHFEVRLASQPVDPLQYLDGSDRLAQVPDSRRSRLSEAGHSVQGRDAAHRARPLVPAVHGSAR